MQRKYLALVFKIMSVFSIFLQMISMISLQIVKHITQNLTYQNYLIIIEEENYGWK